MLLHCCSARRYTQPSSHEYVVASNGTWRARPAYPMPMFAMLQSVKSIGAVVAQGGFRVPISHDIRACSVPSCRACGKELVTSPQGCLWRDSYATGCLWLSISIKTRRSGLWSNHRTGARVPEQCVISSATHRRTVACDDVDGWHALIERLPALEITTMAQALRYAIPESKAHEIEEVLARSQGFADSHG